MTGVRESGAGEPHVFVVDPLDGAEAHTWGARGGAVSLGVVGDGVPVLGVVYAFAAPDDDGDLFAWAQGCGPLQRNGRPVEPPALAEKLSPSQIVLVAWDADRRPEATSTAVMPARFQGVPAMALRLALVAVGEAAACVALDRPRTWSLAAGHALLRAAGGDLLSDDLQSVRYDDQGGNCFGGHPQAARWLASRRWDGGTGADDGGLSWPVRGASIRDPGLLSRAQGCLLGQIAGDNLGAQVEFQTPRAIALEHPNGVRTLVDGGVWTTLAGQPTDDSELALGLARSIVRRGRFEIEDVALAYGAWYQSDPFDTGGTIGRALRAIRPEFSRTAARGRTDLESEMFERGNWRQARRVLRQIAQVRPTDR